MTQEKYYTAPSQEVFDEIRKAAIAIWKTYDNKYGYVTDKLSRIEHLQNVQDNAWYMVAMFDPLNQKKLIKMVSFDTANLIVDAMLFTN